MHTKNKIISFDLPVVPHSLRAFIEVNVAHEQTKTETDSISKKTTTIARRATTLRKHANEAVFEIGLPALLARRRNPGGRLTMKYLSKYLGVDLHVFREGEENPNNNVICTGRNVPLDSSSKQDASEPGEIPANDGHWMGACKSVLQSIVAFPDLEVQICCGIAKNSIPELSIGSLADSDLLTILPHGNQDLMTNWLALESPASILNFVRSKNPSIELPEHFVSQCHVSDELFMRDDVRRVLQKARRRATGELAAHARNARLDKRRLGRFDSNEIKRGDLCN